MKEKTIKLMDVKINKEIDRELEMMKAADDICSPFGAENAAAYGKDIVPILLKQLDMATYEKGLICHTIEALGYIGDKRAMSSIKKYKEEFPLVCSKALSRIDLISKKKEVMP